MPPPLHFRAASPIRTHFRNPLAPAVVADASNPKWLQLCTCGSYVYRDTPINIVPATFDQMIANFHAHPAYDPAARSLIGKPAAEVAPLVMGGRFGVIALNFDHPPPGGPRPGHGWFLDVERRGDQLWGLCFLDPEAHAGMLAAQWKWTSIEWAGNAKNNEGAAIGAYLSGVALTNDPFIRGMQPIQMGGAVAWFGPATDVLCELRCALNLGETADLAAVIGDLAKLKMWALGDAPPPVGVDVGGLVARIRGLLNLPTLAEPASIFAELDKLLSRLAAESPEEPMPPEPQNLSRTPEIVKRFAARFKLAEDEPAVVLAIEHHFQRGEEAMGHVTALSDMLGAKDPKELLGKMTELMSLAAKSKENADALAALVPELEAAEQAEEAAEGDAVTADVGAVMTAKGMDPADPGNIGMSRALRLARIGGDMNFFRFSGVDAKGQPKKTPRLELRQKRAATRAEFLRENGIGLAGAGNAPVARAQALPNYFAGPNAQHGPGAGQPAAGGYMGFANGNPPPPPPPPGAVTWETICSLPPSPKGDNASQRLVDYFARTEHAGKIPDEQTRTNLWKRAGEILAQLPPAPPNVITYFSQRAA